MITTEQRAAVAAEVAARRAARAGLSNQAAKKAGHLAKVYVTRGHTVHRATLMVAEYLKRVQA
jgi:hypothetical protein